MEKRKRILTGYRPTGKLHLGHWFGNLQNMLALQEEYDAFYFVADWHAMTTMWADTHEIRQYTEEQVLDWLAAGLDPDKCTIYRQSDVPEVAELALYFTMVTPMPWLERVPSYKEQRDQITDKDLGNVGFFLYPLLQAADITIVNADLVPVGEDQLPHLELTREIVRRFNNVYGGGADGTGYLVEPAALIPKQGARVPGTDGRKMSKSYGDPLPRRRLRLRRGASSDYGERVGPPAFEALYAW
jgi:tryptophanyl-tRNA synthetase